MTKPGLQRVARHGQAFALWAWLRRPLSELRHSDQGNRAVGGGIARQSALWGGWRPRRVRTPAEPWSIVPAATSRQLKIGRAELSGAASRIWFARSAGVLRSNYRRPATGPEARTAEGELIKGT